MHTHTSLAPPLLSPASAPASSPDASALPPHPTTTIMTPSSPALFRNPFASPPAPSVHTAHASAPAHVHPMWPSASPPVEPSWSASEYAPLESRGIKRSAPGADAPSASLSLSASPSYASFAALLAPRGPAPAIAPPLARPHALPHASVRPPDSGSPPRPSTAPGSSGGLRLLSAGPGTALSAAPAPALTPTPTSHAALVAADGAALDYRENERKSRFVYRLYKMVDDADGDPNAHISWSLNGTSVIISDVDAFTTNFLGQHFNHNNFSSLVRQLNMYVRLPRNCRSPSPRWKLGMCVSVCLCVCVLTSMYARYDGQ